MDIDLIQAFYTLAEHKSFTKAADILCISQSALSHRMHVLEDELGVTLVERGRGKREFHLSPSGFAFVPLAERWIALEKETQYFGREKCIANLAVSNVETLTTLLSDFYHLISVDTTQNYSILCNTYTYPSIHTLNEVEEHNVDIGFTVRKRASRSLKIEPIFREKLYLIGSLHSDRRTIDPRELDPHKELLTDWYTEYRSWHDLYLGTDNHPLAVVDTASMAISFMADGAWCIVPECAVDFIQDNCAMKGIEVGKYNMPSPPPDRICYKVTSRAPRGDKKDIIAYFEERLSEYLKERDLHL